MDFGGSRDNSLNPLSVLAYLGGIAVSSALSDVVEGGHTL